MKPRIEHLALATLLLASGCGGGAEQPAAAKASAKKTGDKAAVTATNAPAATVAATTVSHKALFATNAMKDPFYPQAKAKAETAAKTATAAGAPPAADAIQAALQGGFKGIFGTPDHRVALVYDVPLEEGKNVEIPVTIGGQTKRLKAKVVKVSRTVVELQVEGVPQIVPLTLRGR